MLDASSLAAALADVFASMPPSKEDCALAMANAYRDYAAAGTFGASAPVILDAMRDAMADTLAAGLTVPGLPVTVAGAWAAAVTAFWLPAAVVGPAVGVTAGCPGATALVGALTPVFLNVANTPATCGAGCAAALHAATMTVTATVSPPPATVVPIA